MDMGNIKINGKYRRKSLRENSSKHGISSERWTEFGRNACFVCHKEWCRAWKHKVRMTMGDNVEVKRALFSSFDNLCVVKYVRSGWTKAEKECHRRTSKKRFSQILWFTLRKRSFQLINLYQLNLFSTFEGILNRGFVPVLEDDGCNRNIVSTTFVRVSEQSAFQPDWEKVYCTAFLKTTFRRHRKRSFLTVRYRLVLIPTLRSGSFPVVGLLFFVGNSLKWKE